MRRVKFYPVPVGRKPREVSAWRYNPGEVVERDIPTAKKGSARHKG